MVLLSELRHGNYYYMSDNGLLHRFTIPSLIKLKINRKGKVLNFLPVPFNDHAYNAVKTSTKIIFSVIRKQHGTDYLLHKGGKEVLYSLFKDGIEVRQIFYLHQLQNLIIALTGVEIDVKINEDNPYANFINPN